MARSDLHIPPIHSLSLRTHALLDHAQYISALALGWIVMFSKYTPCLLHAKRHGHLVVCRNLRRDMIDQMSSEIDVYVVPAACACLETRGSNFLVPLRQYVNVDLPERF